jgi:hypothetical protein
LQIIDGIPELRQGEKLTGEHDKRRRESIRKAIQAITPAALKVWFVLGDFCRKNCIPVYETFAAGRPYLARHAEGCYPSVAQIATRANLSKRRVQDLLKELVRLGWIKTQQRDHRASLYWMPRGIPSTRSWYAKAVLGEEFKPKPKAK